MAHVVYVHPLPQPCPTGTGPGASYPVMPVGLVGILNHLIAHGHTVAGVNLGVSRSRDPTFQLKGWLAQHAHAHAIVIDLHWYEHAWGALYTAAMCKAVLPHARVILGGLTATAFAEEVLELEPAVDAVVCGAAEEPVRRLVERADCGDWRPLSVPNVVARDAGGAPARSAHHWQTSPELLSALDTVSLDWMDAADAAAYRRMMHSRPARVTQADVAGQWVLSGRGCAFACAYCGGGRQAHRALSGLSRVARRSPQALASDIDRLSRAGVHQLAPSLDPDMLGSAHRRAFFDALKSRPGLYVESYQLPSADLIERLTTHADLPHTEVALTPLSGDEEVRKRHGKRYDNTHLLDVVGELGRRGIAVFAFFSLNLPGEDNATIEHTVELARRLVDAAPAGLVRTINIAHTIDPRSPMSENPSAHGISEVYLHTLADYVAHAQSPRPFSFARGERGFVVEGRCLETMAERWDAMAASVGPAVIAVPRV